MASKGLDWKADPIGDAEKPGDVPTEDRIKEGLSAFIGGTIPAFAQIKQGAEKEGNILEKAGQVLNPFRAIPLDHSKLSAAFSRQRKIRVEMKQLREKRYKGKPISAANPFLGTKLLGRGHPDPERQFMRSKGKYGRPPTPATNTSSTLGGEGGDVPKIGGDYPSDVPKL